MIRLVTWPLSAGSNLTEGRLYPELHGLQFFQSLVLLHLVEYYRCQILDTRVPHSRVSANNQDIVTNVGDVDMLVQWGVHQVSELGSQFA